MTDIDSTSDENAPPGPGAVPRQRRPVMLVAAVFSKHVDAIRWVEEKLVELYGPIALASEPFSFHHTTYYEKTMGNELRKQLFAFEQLKEEDCLPEIKRQTNQLEFELAGEQRFPEARPVNIDPGILTLGKFQLATTKDQAHRIYLRDGIYAEITLRYQEGEFVAWPWTYADYREPALHEFLLRVRDDYRKRLSATST